ncbi:Dual 3',5'-cyclic-AMP and -GMP phosphodiesterase 11 [Pseudolycoriella hygida]|uniref:Dual 3',5'-cyclic-AMP and -GMP phosphodiesterase 11 n=1 Tax=Pseudolycoriella hygida TaxID=35572 RepID=A0A9Q0S8C9_9DIPT|nr:Dual 3',5'-cyclic-AMP and -GMP phosphodiesterase 11 [Pseudolycoriella hygida]
MVCAFAMLSDKLTPLVDGVRENKVHWLQLAQNAQNNPNRVSIGVSQPIPKIVGKLGRLDSQIFYQKQNGSTCESRDHTDEAMDQ